MNIAISSSGSPVWGGIEAMSELLARGLQARGHEVIVLCRRAGSEFEERLRGHVRCLPILSGFDGHPVTVWRCIEALRRHRTDVVVANGPKDPRRAGVAARLLGIPVVFRHEIDLPYRSAMRHQLYHGWLPAVHVVNSEATRTTVLASLRSVTADRIAVIPNGIDVERYASAAPADLGLPPDAVSVGYVGRMESRKGVRELAAAWPRVAEAIPAAHLVLAGWGPLAAHMRELLGAGPRVRWLGFRSDVPAIMKALDLLVAPSYYEGFGLVLVEGMAAGVPVITCDASSMREIVRDKIEGWLVPPRDADALAEAIIALSSNAAMRAQMGEAGRRRARERYGAEQMIQRHCVLLRQMVGS